MNKNLKDGYEDEQFLEVKSVEPSIKARSIKSTIGSAAIEIVCAFGLVALAVDVAQNDHQENSSKVEVEQIKIETKTPEKIILAKVARPDLLEGLEEISAYPLKEYGYVLEFKSMSLYSTETDKDNDHNVGYIKHDLSLDALQLKYQGIIEGKKTSFWHPVDDVSLFSQLVKNAAEVIDYATKAKQAYEKNDAYPKVNDLAFFPKDPVDFKREGYSVTITFNNAGIICSASLEDTEIYSSGGYYNLMDCKPLLALN